MRDFDLAERTAPPRASGFERMRNHSRLTTWSTAASTPLQLRLLVALLQDAGGFGVAVLTEPGDA